MNWVVKVLMYTLLYILVVAEKKSKFLVSFFSSFSFESAIYLTQMHLNKRALYFSNFLTSSEAERDLFELKFLILFFLVYGHKFVLIFWTGFKTLKWVKFMPLYFCFFAGHAIQHWLQDTSI